MPEKTFEWYKTITELARFEVEHGRTRFYETTKIHLAALSGIVALVSYGVTHPEALRPILSMATLLCLAATFAGWTWIKQIDSSFKYEARWQKNLAQLEEHEAFRTLVGAREIKVWSESDLVKVNPYKHAGASPTMYRVVACGFICLFVVLGFSCLIRYLGLPGPLSN